MRYVIYNLRTFYDLCVCVHLPNANGISKEKLHFFHHQYFCQINVLIV